MNVWRIESIAKQIGISESGAFLAGGAARVGIAACVIIQLNENLNEFIRLNRARGVL